MPKKSRRTKTLQYQRKQERQRLLAADVPPPAVTPDDQPVARTTPLAPASASPSAKAASTGTRYPYVAAELRRIGLLAGIMLVVLVVLALVLS
jgi:hypothetical protein